MKRILLLISIISFSANARTFKGEIIKGINIDQKMKCRISKVYKKPKGDLGEIYNINVGNVLSVEFDGRKTSHLTIRDLIQDMPFSVGKFSDWFYQELDRGARFEKLCKSKCLIYSTIRGGRWVFYPQRNGTMKVTFAQAPWHDIKDGRKNMDFKCTKSRSR